MYNTKRVIQLSDTVKKLSFGKNFLLNRHETTYVCDTFEKMIEILNTFSEVHPSLREKMINEVSIAKTSYGEVTIISHDKFEVVIFYGSLLQDDFCREVIIL